MPKRIRVGDVLKIAAPGEPIYLHYLGRHPSYGDAVAVSTVKNGNQNSTGPDLFKDSYFIFYPAAAALNQGMATVVGNLASPGIPERMRRPGARVGGRIKTWIIEDAGGDIAVKQELTNEEAKLPIAVIWNHEFLLHRVHEGWRPEMFT